MLRNLIQTGNSKALILTKDMRDHLGVEDEVEVEFRRGSIVLRHPEVPDEDLDVAAPKKAKAPKEKPTVAEEPKVKSPKEVKVKAEKAKPEKVKAEKPKDKAKKKKGK